MEKISELFNKDHMGEFVLTILIIIFCVVRLRIPSEIALVVDSLVGRIVIILLVLYLFLHANPILAVVAAYAAFDLMRRSSSSSQYAESSQPSEQTKMSQFTAYNQFPYTLEQEVVAKMAPLVQSSGSSINSASYKPVLDNLHDATPL
jgi:hypothetical protein